MSMDIDVMIVLDSKDLFAFLSNKRNRVEKWIRDDLNCSPFGFEAHNVQENVWIPESCNLADPGTKT